MSNLPTTNNNPGDLRDIGQTGATEGSGGFAKFNSPKEGFGALLNDVQTKINNHPNETLVDFSNTYAPPTDGNDSAQYAANLANQLDVAPNATLSSLQPNIGKFAEAIASNEGYQGSLPNLESSANSTSNSIKTQNLAPTGVAGAAALGAAGIGATVATDGADLWGEAGSLLGDLGKGLGGWLGLSNSNNQVSQPQNNQSQPSFSSDISKSGQATSDVNNAIMETLQGTQSNRVFSQSQPGTNGVQAASMFNLIHPDDNGNLVYDSEKGKQLMSDVANLDDKVIATHGGTASPVSVANYAGTEIGNNKLSTDSDRKEASRIMQQEMTSDLNGIPMNGEMSLSDMREKEKQHNAAARDAYKQGNYTPTPKSLAHKALGKAYGRAISENLKDPHSKALHEKAKKMEHSLIQAREVGKRLNGKKAPKKDGLWESFLRHGARAAEIYIGDRIGGPVGAIIAGIIGEGFNRKLTKKFGRNIFETKGMRAAFDILRDTKPKEYQELISELEKHGTEVPEEKNTDTKIGLINIIKNDEKDMKGKKGLIKIR